WTGAPAPAKLGLDTWAWRRGTLTALRRRMSRGLGRRRIRASGGEQGRRERADAGPSAARGARAGAARLPALECGGGRGRARARRRPDALVARRGRAGGRGDAGRTLPGRGRLP